jgi:DNA-binding CsgD family transcriptional regulator
MLNPVLHDLMPPRHPTIGDAGLSSLLTALMDRIECGMLACSADGELLHANLAARRELATAQLLHLDDDGIVRCQRGSSEAWVASLHNAALRHLSSMVQLREGAAHALVAVSPAAVGTQHVAIAVIGRRNLCSPLGLEMLASSYGLTFAESRVLRALIDSQTVREIADTHGVAVTTIRTQVLAIREKLGVRSIDALLLRAAEVPPITARH